jgi:hypothetical protein
VCTRGSEFDSIEQSVSIRLALKQQKYFSPLDFLSGIWPKLLAKDPSVIHARGPKITLQKQYCCKGWSEKAHISQKCRDPCSQKAGAVS